MLASLRKLGRKKLANELEKYQKVKEEIISVEGIIPYESRPAATKKILSEGNKKESNAFWNIIWRNRNKRISIK